MKCKRKILIFIGYYLPGQNIGGPLNSVLNIVKSLREDFDFFIITSNRDLGDRHTYNLAVNVWLDVEGAKVMYLKHGPSFFLRVYQELRKDTYNIVYLNSIFDFKFSVYVVFLKYCRLFQTSLLIVAPRGELVSAALKFRKYKKKIFLIVTNSIRFYRGVIWHSTADFETLSIQNCIRGSIVRFARVIANSEFNLKEIDNLSFDLTGKFLKIIFLSRISKEKNLIYALKVLSKVSCRVEFHIYGPIEESDIWKECMDFIDLMPMNIKVKYGGIVQRNLVKSYFSKYDLFFFPTFIENYGHVINEALSVGTSVLVSDNTPWRFLESKGLGWDVNLENMNDFVFLIEDFAKLSTEQLRTRRNNVLNCYNKSIDKTALITENRKLFELS